MYAENDKINDALVAKNDFSTGGVSSSISDTFGWRSASVSVGDRSKTFEFVSDGDCGTTDGSEDNDVSMGDINNSQYSATLVSFDYTENLAAIETHLESIDSLLFLILLFMLLDWTASKIFISVRRFTRERRR